MPVALGVIGVVVGVISAVAKATAAENAIVTLIGNLRRAETELRTRITETNTERDRRNTQLQTNYNADLTASQTATTTALAQSTGLRTLAIANYTAEVAAVAATRVAAQADVKRRKDALDIQYADDIVNRARAQKDLEDTLKLTLANITQQEADLQTNKDARIADLTRQQEEAAARKDMTLESLTAQAAAGDVEAARKVEQIGKTLVEMKGNVTDAAIIQMNEAGDQNKFDIGKLTTEQMQANAKMVAGLAASGIKRSGTPLMALHDASQQLQETLVRAGAKADASMVGAQTETAAKINTLRSTAQGNIEDVAAANLAFDQGLDRDRAKTVLEFTQTYAGLVASKADVERQTIQDTARLEASKAAESQLEAQRSAGLTAAGVTGALQHTAADDAFTSESAAIDLTASQSTTRLAGQEAVAAQTYTNEQTNIQAAATEHQRVLLQTLTTNQADITAAASLATAGMQRQITESTRQRNLLNANRNSIVAAAALGGISEILTSANTFLTTLGAA
jgi:hypothetical protein